MTSPARSALPEGTITFLFLDIEKSTELLEEVGPAYTEVLRAFRELSNQVVGRHGGVVFGAEGDGIFVAFPEAVPGALAAIELQRAFAGHDWTGGVQVRVRMGLHTGTPIRIGDDYTGIDVHRAARIMGAGWGGQILISESTRSLIADAAIRTRELGWYAMKGLSRHERLYQVEAEGLPGAFPAVRARRREVDLPVELTSLIGRESNIETVIGMLADGARLVTLSGPGGIGKTRIALAVADRLDSEYADGVAFADVSNETDPGRAAVVIAESVGATYEHSRSAMDSLMDHLAPRHLLLVIDGFERFSGEAIGIADLLAQCPRLQLLVTSRVVLRIAVEREHRVGPLELAPPNAPLGQIAASPAVRLFLDRARPLRPDLQLTEENAGVIRDLVARLEGVPLSIELAAARARLLAPEAILERLGSLLDLGAASPDLPARHRSLRATIEWSHGLLDPPDQQLLRRLGVFVDGWTLEAAEAVAGEGSVDVVLALEDLVTQSMIHLEPTGRMSMGPALREFAIEQLVAAGEEHATRLGHASFFADLAERTEPLLRGTRQRELLATLSREWQNFRAAGNWALSQDEVNLAGRLYTNIWIVSWQGDNWGESESFTRRFAPLMDRLDEPIRARALFVAGGTYMEMGRWDRAIAFARPAVELSKRIGDREAEAWSSLILAGSLAEGDRTLAEAKELIDEAVALARDIGDHFLLGYALSFQGSFTTLSGDFENGLAHHRESLAIGRALENPAMVGQALSQIAMTHLASGDPRSARSALEECLEGLDEIHSLEVIAVILDSVAWLAFAEADPVRAVTALGAADAARSGVGAARWSIVAGLLEAAGLAAESEDPSLAEARRAGSEMSPKDAIGLGMSAHRELAAAG